MKSRIPALFIILAMTLALALAGCAAPATGGTDKASPKPESTVAQPSEAAGATAEPAADATDAPAGPKDTASSPAFKYYSAVKLGMTKEEADKAIGLEAKKATGEYEPEGSYNYIDADGNGVYVIYNKDMKAFAKTAVYAKESEAVAPLTAKPVTEDQKKQIKKGTSYTDVVALLGGDGVEFTQTATEKNPTATPGHIYHWANADGSYIQIAFDSEGNAQNIMFNEAR